MSQFSLSIRLTLFFTVIVLLVTAILSSVVFYEFQNKIKQQIRLNLTDAAEHKALELQNVLQFEKTNLMAWRASSVMQDAIVDDLDKRISTELIGLKNYYALHGDLYVFNANGILIASTQPEVIGQKIPATWVDNEDYHFAVKHQVPFIHEDIVAHVAALKPPQLPVQGMLVLTHDWNDLSRYFQPDNDYFALCKDADTQAELFTETGSETLALTQDFSAQNLWQIADKPYLGAISKVLILDDFSFRIAVFSPESSAREPVRQLIFELIIAAISVVVPMTLVAMWLSRRFVMPIKRLTVAIRHIEHSNDLSIKVPVKGRDEVANLADAFNKMTANLSEAFSRRENVEKELEILNLSLERQIDERTSELRQALEQLKSAQSHLVQSEKMVSLGQLVAGIAHEINNPVGAIYANMPILRDYVHDFENALSLATTCCTALGESKLHEFLQEIDYEFISHDLQALISSQQQAAERIRNIVLALRNFSRLDQGEVKNVLLEEGIDCSLQMLHHQYKNRLDIQKDYRLNTPVECYAGELNQVFMNILANAIQAMPEQGVIRISTAKQDDQAIISITDTGKGMSDEVKAKIFDPFFTTKEVGEGTGLGLSISYGIIEKHHGTVTVKSELNVGTCFTLTLPLHLAKVT
jgi:signal transduction histidine kinase